MVPQAVALLRGCGTIEMSGNIQDMETYRKSSGPQRCAHKRNNETLVSYLLSSDFEVSRSVQLLTSTVMGSLVTGTLDLSTLEPGCLS